MLGWVAFLNPTYEISDRTEDLWDSILEHQEELPLSPAQQQELERRLENYEKNSTNASTWEEVKNRFR